MDDDDDRGLINRFKVANYNYILYGMIIWKKRLLIWTKLMPI